MGSGANLPEEAAGDVRLSIMSRGTVVRFGRVVGIEGGSQPARLSAV